MNKFPSETVEAITKFLFVGKPVEELGKYDLVLVLGNHLPGRTVDELVKLRDGGCLDDNTSIIFSGSTGLLNQGHEPEAEEMSRLAVERGFLAENLVVEPRARNTYENLALAKEKMQELEASRGGAEFKAILCVGQAFLMRRAKMCAARCSYPTEKMSYYGVVDREGRNIGPDSWWKSEVARKRVLEELGRISEYALKGDLGLE